jgi:hypothetical protein
MRCVRTRTRIRRVEVSSALERRPPYPKASAGELSLAGTSDRECRV